MSMPSAVQPKYRWDAADSVWQFYEAAWGGWNTLRRGMHISTPPMTFEQGCDYLRRRGEDPHSCGAPGPVDEVDSVIDRFKKACGNLEYSPFDDDYGAEYVAARSALRAVCGPAFNSVA